MSATEPLRHPKPLNIISTGDRRVKTPGNLTNMANVGWRGPSRLLAPGTLEARNRRGLADEPSAE
eukprot:2007301-Lingulodinium_polyedra.AAC.1